MSKRVNVGSSSGNIPAEGDLSAMDLLNALSSGLGHLVNVRVGAVVQNENLRIESKKKSRICGRLLVHSKRIPTLTILLAEWWTCALRRTEKQARRAKTGKKQGIEDSGIVWKPAAEMKICVFGIEFKREEFV